MTIQSVADLIEALEQNQLLHPHELDALKMNLQAGFSEPAELAEDLVRRGTLTLYQAKQIFLGKASDLLLGQYVIVDLLGEGAMGQVFKARHRRLDRFDAVKVIQPNHLASPNALSRFHLEAKAAGRLSHPNIVTIYDADEFARRHFIAMEYVEGIELSRLVQQFGPLPAALACEYAAQAARGLQHAHSRDLVHRDVKPSNLLVTNDRTLVKILDMGLALLHQSAAGGLTQSGVVMGTPDYMAPEQAVDSHHVDIRADVYGLGCTLYFLLTGRPPFPGGTMTQKLHWHQQVEPTPIESLRTDLSPALVAAVRRMMAKCPEDRFQTPAEVAEALEPLRRESDGSPVQAAALTWAPIKIGPAPPTEAPLGVQTVEYRPQDPPGTPGQGASTAAGAPQSHPAEPGKHPRARGADGTVPLERVVEPSKKGKAAYWFAGLAVAGVLAILAWSVPWTQPSTTKPRGDDGPDEVQRFSSHQAPVLCVAFSRKGNAILSGHSDGRLCLHSVGRSETFCSPGHTQGVMSVAFSAGGGRALSGAADATIRLWNVENLGEVRMFKGHTQIVFSVALSSNNQYALTGGARYNPQQNRLFSEAALQLWDVDSGEEVRRFEGHQDVVSRVAFLPGDEQAVSASFDHTLRLWTVATGKELRVFEGVPAKVTALAVSPDGRRLLSGSDDETLRLWDVSTGKEVWQVNAKIGTIPAVAFAPDGRRFLTGSGDESVRLWDAETGKELKRYTGHGGLVTCAAFAPDGEHAVTGSEDKTLRLWKIPK